MQARSQIEMPAETIPRESFGALLSQLADHSSALVRDEMALARQEIRESFRSLRVGATTVAIGALIGSIALITLTAAAVIGLAHYIDAGYAALITGGALAFAGVGVALAGLSRLKRTNLRPEQTMETLEEDKAMAETSNLAARQRIDESGERSAREIRQNIAAQRETIAETVDKLGDRIHQTFDWREYVAEYPVAALGLAAGTGILLSAVFKREPTPQERILDAIADMTEDFTDRISGVAGHVIQRKLVSGRTVKAAVTAMLTKAAIELAKRKLGEGGAGRRVEQDDIPTREREALAKL